MWTQIVIIRIGASHLRKCSLLRLQIARLAALRQLRRLAAMRQLRRLAQALLQLRRLAQALLQALRQFELRHERSVEAVEFEFDDATTT